MADNFLCPFCLKEHKKKDCIYRCTAERCLLNVPRDEHNIIPYSSIKVCSKKCDQRFLALCPNQEDGVAKIIPTRAMDQSMSLALLGGRNSGKSNYIAILVNEIKRKMSYIFNCSLMTCDDTTEIRYKSFFYDPIFKDHRPLDSTDAGRQDPLLFTLDFYKKSIFGDSMKSLLLPLYDTAGENMQNETKMVENVNYIQSAGGIILLLDPFEIDEIAEILKINDVKNNVDGATKMEDILNRLQIILQRNDTHKIIETPLAIVLTKLDLLNDSTNLISEDSVLRNESAHLLNGYFSQREFEAVDSAVRDILRGSSDSQNLFMKLKAFKNAAFFAVTSFGCDPNTADLRRSMKPMRVLDPLLWLLSINGYIKTGK